MTIIIDRKKLEDWLWLGGLIVTLLSGAFYVGYYLNEFNTKQDNNAQKLNYLIALSRDKTKKDSLQDIKFDLVAKDAAAQIATDEFQDKRLARLEAADKSGVARYVTAMRTANGIIFKPYKN